mmetsp:Transcript_4729/g.7351  ORF Transcript_4729/g.7351 Transcript_4729/m.7351 type:complete len:83 (-) Transcript_4729:392-640(-)
MSKAMSLLPRMRTGGKLQWMPHRVRVLNRRQVKRFDAAAHSLSVPVTGGVRNSSRRFALISSIRFRFILCPVRGLFYVPSLG